MNTTLNINRLGLLFKRYFTENKNRELTFWGITTIIFMFVHSAPFLAMYLYISGLVFAARMFKIFAYTPQGMHYLLIPATHTEKLVTSILLSTFYFFGMFLITYTIGTIIGITGGNLIFGTNNPIIFELFKNNSYINPYRTFDLWDTFINFSVVQALFSLGSLYFKRNAIAGTILSLFVISFALGLTEALMLKLTIGTYHLNGHSFNLTVPAGTNLFPGIEMMGTVFRYAAIPFLWTVSYFRLTEKEL